MTPLVMVPLVPDDVAFVVPVFELQVGLPSWNVNRMFDKMHVWAYR